MVSPFCLNYQCQKCGKWLQSRATPQICAVLNPSSLIFTNTCFLMYTRSLYFVSTAVSSFRVTLGRQDIFDHLIKKKSQKFDASRSQWSQKGILELNLIIPVAQTVQIKLNLNILLAEDKEIHSFWNFSSRKQQLKTVILNNHFQVSFPKITNSWNQASVSSMCWTSSRAAMPRASAHRQPQTLLHGKYSNRSEAK